MQAGGPNPGHHTNSLLSIIIWVNPQPQKVILGFCFPFGIQYVPQAGTELLSWLSFVRAGITGKGHHSWLKIILTRQNLCPVPHPAFLVFSALLGGWSTHMPLNERGGHRTTWGSQGLSFHPVGLRTELRLA